MTKEWERYKNEIERLYISESKKLEEVQRILRSQGFDASIRAYRMKLDEWGLRKYATVHVDKKRRRTSPEPQEPEESAIPSAAEHQSTAHPPTHHDEAASTRRHRSSPRSHQIPSTSSEGSITIESSNFEDELTSRLAALGVVLPSGRVRVDQLVKFLWAKIPAAQLDECLFESLLLKWQTDGTYLKAALGLLPDYHVFSLLQFSGGNIFEVIEDRVGTVQERHVLVKACLKRTLDTVSSGERKDCYGLDEWSLTFYDWQKILADAAKAVEWAEVNDIIDVYGRGADAIGASFVALAPVVIAEDILDRGMTSLKDMMRKKDLGFDDEQRFRAVRDQYTKVLEDFFIPRPPELDLDRSYYKFALEMGAWYENRKAKELLALREQLHGMYWIQQ
ncbi:hypothetical protein BDZ45DRAFT_262037 [Acephala macrosclerotiorum]|nr:hypothetical protein BDZ45DRAFT_262037 [Acephala macrosclerotiorum]